MLIFFLFKKLTFCCVNEDDVGSAEYIYFTRTDDSRQTDQKLRLNHIRGFYPPSIWRIYKRYIWRIFTNTGNCRIHFY